MSQGEIKSNLENETQSSHIDNQNESQTNQANNESRYQDDGSLNNTITNNEFMKTIDGYLHSADKIVNEAGKIASKYGNPVVDFSSKMVIKFKEYFHLI